jgi:hypothetical protein
VLARDGARLPYLLRRACLMHRMLALGGLASLAKRGAGNRRVREGSGGWGRHTLPVCAASHTGSVALEVAWVVRFSHACCAGFVTTVAWGPCHLRTPIPWPICWQVDMRGVWSLPINGSGTSAADRSLTGSISGSLSLSF